MLLKFEEIAKLQFCNFYLQKTHVLQPRLLQKPWGEKLQELGQNLPACKSGFATSSLFLLVLVVMFSSCSSVPKRPAEVFVIQSMVETSIGIANQEADKGAYTEALETLTEAWRLAVTSDRPALRVRVRLAQANALYSLGRTEEAERRWNEAEEEAMEAEETELASASRVYRARSMLISGRMTPSEALALAQNEHSNLKKDKLLIAANWTLQGLAEKELGLFEDAEKSIMNALVIHEKDRYLEQAAYDWYLIASIRSVAGDFEEAIEALDHSIVLDRRAENTFGLAMSWSAKGEVYHKMAETDFAIQAWRRSADIFTAMDRPTDARELQSRIRQVRRDTGTPSRRPDGERRSWPAGSENAHQRPEGSNEDAQRPESGRGRRERERTDTATTE